MSRLTTTMLADWLKPLITSGARVFPGRIPDEPNRIIGVVKGAGPGLEMDELFDVMGITITSRGAENNIDDAEKIAGEVDDIFLGKSPGTGSQNFLIGVGAASVFVNGIGRTGGAPTQLPLPDSQSRYVFTCTYYAYVSTNVGQVFNG
jgi:hypothetical protein